MHEMMPITSFKNKCFDTMRCICELDLACQNLLNEQTQENIDKFVELAKKYQDCNEILQASLIKFINTVTDENEEIAIEDEYKI